MHYSSFSKVRDVVLLCALFFLAKIAFERTASFINDHKKSIIHELDRDFMDQIYTAQKQLHFLQNQYEHPEEIAQELAHIKKELAIIEEKYKTNSPGVMFLGPIGSAAIVAKEAKLKKKLLDTANTINKIAHTVHDKADEFQPSTAINIALECNKKLLHTATA
jgi:hypothetical protein